MDKANEIEVSIDYDIGGMNYFTGQNETRGYYFSITPYKVERGWRSYTAFSESKMCVLPVKRKSKSAEARADMLFDTLEEKYLADWCKRKCFVLG